VFERADTYPAIFILSPRLTEAMRVVQITDPQQLNLAGVKGAPETLISPNTLSEAPWNLGGLDLLTVLNTKNVSWTELANFGKAYYSIVTGMDSVFVVDARLADQLSFKDEIVYPFAYRGNEIIRYSNVKPSARLIYPYREGNQGEPNLISESELKSRYPNIYEHLAAHKGALQQRRDSRKQYALGKNWYRHVRPGSFLHIHAEKLLFKGIDTNTTVGLLREGNAFSGANCPGVILENAGNHSQSYVLGLLNSKLLSYYLRKTSPAKLSGYTRFNAKSISKAPIRTIDFSDSEDVARHDRMVGLVERMLELHERLAEVRIERERTVIGAQISATDRQIDRLVYDLYGLTEEEMAVVEGESR
jgi:hypothetical protein